MAYKFELDIYSLDHNLIFEDETYIGDLEKSVEQWCSEHNIRFVSDKECVAGQTSYSPATKEETTKNIYASTYYLKDNDAVMFKMVWGEIYYDLISPDFF